MLSLLLLLAVAQEIPESQLEWQKGDDEFFPMAFRGTWAPRLADCNGNSEEAFEVTATKLWFYEGDAKLIKISNVNHVDGPGGVPAYTLNAYTASRDLMDLSTGTVRLTLSGDKLYMTRATAVAESKQWQFSNVRCPNSRTK